MSDIVDRAAEALRNAPIPAGPPADVLAATTAAVGMAAETNHSERRRRVMRYVRRTGALTAAAAIVGLIWGFRATPASAWAESIDRAVAAETVTAALIQQAGDGPAQKSKVYGRGSSIRMDIYRDDADAIRDGKRAPSVTYVGDVKAKKGVMIDHRAKTVIPLPGFSGYGQPFSHFVDRFYQLRGQTIQETREDETEGKPARVYKMTVIDALGMRGKADVSAWVDPSTQLPVRLDIDDANEKVRLRLRFENFAWNEKLDDVLFDQTVPAGYTMLDSDKLDSEKTEPAIFHRAIDNAERTNSVRVIISMKQNGVWVPDKTITLQGDQSRVDLPRDPFHTRVADAKTGVSLRLSDDGVKTAERRKESPADTAQNLKIWRSVFVNIKYAIVKQSDDGKADYKNLGFEMLGDRRAAKFEVRMQRRGREFVSKVWIDPNTELPIRVEGFQWDDESDEESYWRTEFEKWGETFDPALFSLDVPAGYKLIEPDKPAEEQSISAERTQFVVFRQALDNIEKAKSLRAVIRTTTTVLNKPEAPPEKVEQKLYVLGNSKMRFESGPDSVTVVDIAGQKVVSYDRKAKFARTLSLAGAQDERQTYHIALVKKLTDRKEGAEDLGEQYLDGRKVNTYRIRGLEFGMLKGDATYWIDAKRNLPARFKMAGTFGPWAETLTIDYLGFDEELDPKLFDIPPLDGYKVEELKLQEMKPADAK